MSRNVISFHALYNDAFHFAFDNDVDDILIYKYGSFIFNFGPCNGVYEGHVCVGTNNIMLNVGSSSVLDKLCLWDYHLGHVNKKGITKLQKVRILESFELESNDVCECFFLEKIPNAPFT